MKPMNDLNWGRFPPDQGPQILNGMIWGGFLPDRFWAVEVGKAAILPSNSQHYHTGLAIVCAQRIKGGHNEVQITYIGIGADRVCGDMQPHFGTGRDSALR